LVGYIAENYGNNEIIICGNFNTIIPTFESNSNVNIISSNNQIYNTKGLGSNIECEIINTNQPGHDPILAIIRNLISR
jgi:hypothetical protein